MKLVTTIVTLTLLAVPISASAQIDLTWDNCVIAGTGEPLPAFSKMFDCDSPQTYLLHGSFKPPLYLPDFFAMDIVIDLYWWSTDYSLANQPLHPFWHFETGGCNAGGIILSASRYNSGGCSQLVSPWGHHGEPTIFAGIAGYGPDYQQPGRGRILATVARAQNDPFPLQAGTNYFAFHIQFSTDQAGSCAGCEDLIMVLWSSTMLISANHPVVVLTGPDKGEAFYAAINADKFFIPDPVVATTWGQIKSQYR